MLRDVKVAVHTAAWVSRWGEDLSPHLELAASLGFDGAEVSLLGLDAAAAGRLARVAGDLGLTLKCTTGLSPATDVTSPDPEVRRAGVRYLAEAADVVAACGSDLLSGVIYGPWGVGATGHRAERLGRAAEALAEVAPTFADRGIELAVEPLNRFETDLLNTSAEACDLVRAVAMPNVGVLLDSFHMNIEETSVKEAVLGAAGHLVHVQVADNDRGAPGSGHIDWDGLFEGLDAIGYAGWLSLEMFLRAGLDVSADLRIWRDISPDPTESARAGLSFVRARLAGEPT